MERLFQYVYKATITDGLRRFLFAVRMPTTRSASNSVASADRLAIAAPPSGRKRKTVDISVESSKSAKRTKPITPARVKRARSTNKKSQADDFNEELSEISEPRTPARKSTSARKRSAISAVEHGSVTPKPFISKYFLDLDPNTTVIPARLPFDFEEAKAHLIAADERFEELFRKLKCKPFENPEPVDPFRCESFTHPVYMCLFGTEGNKLIQLLAGHW